MIVRGIEELDEMVEEDKGNECSSGSGSSFNDLGCFESRELGADCGMMCKSGKQGKKVGRGHQ